MYSIDIKDALNDGISFEDLMRDFKYAIEDAQDEIEAEKANTAHNEGLDKCREDVMVALVSYLDTLGVLDVDTVSEDDMEKLEEYLKDFETEVTKMMSIINLIIDNNDSEGVADADVKSDKAEITDILTDVLAKLG